MKKRVFLLLQIAAFCILVVSVSFGQKPKKWRFGNKIGFDLISTDKSMIDRQPYIYYVYDTAVYEVFEHLEEDLSKSNYESDRAPKTPIILGVKLNHLLTDFYSSEVKSITKSYASYVISDSSDAVLIALGITSVNEKDFRYHVVENDSLEIVPWSNIPKMKQNYGAKQPYAFLGKYNKPGKRILIEVVSTKNYSIRDGVIFDWRVNYRPIITKIVAVSSSSQYINLNSLEKKYHYADHFDRLTGLPLNLKFPMDSIMRFRFHFKNHETLPYAFYLIKDSKGKKDTTLLDFWKSENYYDFSKDYFSKPGKYEFIIQRSREYWASQYLVRIPFEVLPPPLIIQKFSIEQILPYGLGAILFIALLFTLYYFYNKRKLRIAAQQKELVNIRLKSIRSQLNPHFMFNALSSIQNLMNKKDIEGANHYLAKFSNLTREVLNTGEHELISLEDEIKMLNDYLQMEQLRFRFQYSIQVDENINRANVEIPAMLLQPFVENAVKHGISSLKESGVIDILIEASEKDLILSVTDNGKGFAASIQDKERTSFGLKLSKERIALINQIYKDQKSTLNIDSKPTGTTITISLNNWL